MSIKAQLTEDMKTAMRARDSISLDAIRFLMADIKNFEIDNGEQDDAGIQKIVAKQIKQMREAIAEYDRGGRQDLVDAETAKLKVLEAYLPAQLSDEELMVIVQKVKAANPTVQGGQLIGLVMKEVQGLADGGRVAAALAQSS